MENCCLKILREIVVGKSFGKCGKIYLGNHCGKILQEIFMGKSCGKILRENLALNHCGKIIVKKSLWEVIVEKSL